MLRSKIIIVIAAKLMLLSLLLQPEAGHAQEPGTTEPVVDELLLSFSYPSAGRVFVMGRYDYESQRMHLPVVEIFSLLEIYLRTNQEKDTITGTYLVGGDKFAINFKTYTVTVGKNQKEFSSEWMSKGAYDYYLAVEVFEEMFDMVFTYNLSNLSLSLDTPHVMPVVDKSNRQAARDRIESLSLGRSYYPLGYERQRSFLKPGFMDYNIGITSQPESMKQDYNFQLVAGIEALGGEVRARNAFGYSSNEGWFRRYGNINWKYSVRDLSAFSSVQVGQINTRGLQTQQINGISVTNNPIEPRQAYGETTIDGNTQPDAEVELYLNNELIDFTTSDAQGYYRFNVPLRYGSTSLRTQVYTSDGQLIVNENEIQVPFTFLPKGDLTYNVQAGYMEYDSRIQNFGMQKAANADISYGLNNWLTTKVGMEYNDVDLKIPALYSSTTARVLKHYLLNIEYVPSYFYRAQSSVVFNSNRSVSAVYTNYEDISRFNLRGAEHQFSGNIYTPLPFSFLNAGIRLSVDHTKLSSITETRFRSDVFSQFGPFNLRFNYSDNLVKSERDLTLTGGTMTGALTYKFTRRSGLKALAGSFIRMSAIYNRQRKSIQQYDMQVSKSVFNRGQFTVGFSRLVPSSQNYLQIGFNIDLGGRVRSSTTGVTNFSSSNITQSLRGSVGYDNRFDEWQAIDRQQVGKAGASVVLFIDNDNSGNYSDGDEVIPYPAIKLNRSAQMNVSKNGIVRISQLQANYRYNLEIDRGEIPNPLYMPAKDKFSFIADPNQFKTIEVPFYRSGAIEGYVYYNKDEVKEGLGGLRLTIKGIDRDFETKIRTFRGGSFYALDIPPGRYTLEVDPEQLAYIGAAARDGVFKFEVEAKAQGDYLDDLELILIPQGDQ